MPDNRNQKDPLEEHPIVKKLIQDPSRPPDTVILVGYPGRSTSKNVLRLYDDLRLKSYKEIDKKDILHADNIPKDVMPEGATMIWVSKDAQITYTTVDTAKIAARYLEGDIARTYITPPARSFIARREAMLGGVEALALPRSQEGCPIVTEPPACLQSIFRCLPPTPEAPCRTPQLTCPSDRCPSPIDPCRTQLCGPTPRGLCGPTPNGLC